MSFMSGIRDEISEKVSAKSSGFIMRFVTGVRRVFTTIYRGQQNINFPRLWFSALILSAILVVVSFASFLVRGLDLGIDFTGGTAWEVQASGVSVAETRKVLQDTQAGDAKIQTVGGDTIRVRSDIDDSAAVEVVRDSLAELAQVEPTEVSISTVGPSWGSQVTGKARNALLIFFALVAAYMAVRLEWKMAFGALVAVMHDIVICVGVYSLFQFEITPATVIAFLTIMGYSLYDTIVVYDKVRDVVGRLSGSKRYTYTTMMNLSLNQVFMRSVNTSITSTLPVASMLVIGSFLLGAVTLQEFSIALLIGIVVGTYSSLFVAAAVVAAMKEREPAYKEIADKVRLRSRDTNVRRSNATEPKTSSSSSVLASSTAASQASMGEESNLVSDSSVSSSTATASTVTTPDLMLLLLELLLLRSKRMV